MPTQPPVFGRSATARRKPWARPEGEPDRRLRGRAGVKLRARVRREEPLCRSCLGQGLTAATEEVDHVVPLSRGGTDARTNLQGLCGDCHRAKTLAEASAARG